MIPVGETLRRERLKRNLDLEEISGELKISTRFLQAIENDQYDKLPGGVFAKSFVRQYARLLGLDDEDLAGQVQQVLGSTELPAFVEQAKPAGFVPIQVPKVEEWEMVGDKRFKWSGWLSALVLVVVMLVCSAVYAWMQRPKPVVTAQSTTPPAPSAVQSAPAPPPVAVDPSAAPGATATTPAPGEAAPAPAQATEQKPPEQNAVEHKPAEQKPSEPKAVEPKPTPVAVPVTPPNPDATVHLEITADEPVWVSARIDGKYAFSGTMEPNTTRTVEGLKEVILRLGNAGGVTIQLNGKSIGPAGPKGQIRTIQFTSGGFQIGPAKPAVPLDPLGRF